MSLELKYTMSKQSLREFTYFYNKKETIAADYRY